MSVENNQKCFSPFLARDVLYFEFLAATAALEGQMLVHVSVCLSHLLQLYWTSAGLLKDFSRTSEGLGTSEGLLKDF